MMANFKTLLASFVLLFVCVLNVQAEDAESVVVVEIDASELDADAVASTISTPVEVLMRSLDGVKLISAKSSDGEASISVSFGPTENVTNDAVERVRNALEGNLGQLPDTITSFSVSYSAVIQKQIRAVPPRSFAGRYLGRIESSNEFLPIITVFNKASNPATGTSAGLYYMSEPTRLINGRLTNCTDSSAREVKCRWQDRYGSGDVTFGFNGNYSSFEGRWTVKGSEGEFAWSGFSVKLPAE